MCKTTQEVLESMLETERSRRELYGNNSDLSGRILHEMFPRGVILTTAEQHAVWQLFCQLVNKISRFAVTDLSHADSIHDAAVYAAMIEAMITKEK